MADSFSKEYCIHQRIHIFAYFCNHQPRMFIETKFDCHILHSVSKAEKLEHIAHSYASCSFIFPKEHHLLFGRRLHASEGSNYFNQCCALCSYNGMHYPFSRNGVHVESPCESNTSRDAAVSSRERAKREREATFFKECRNSLQNTTAHRQHIYWMILLETSF